MIRHVLKFVNWGDALNGVPRTWDPRAWVHDLFWALFRGTANFVDDYGQSFGAMGIVLVFMVPIFALLHLGDIVYFVSATIEHLVFKGVHAVGLAHAVNHAWLWSEAHWQIQEHAKASWHQLVVWDDETYRRLIHFHPFGG